jgi:hypothetical protein
MAEKVAKLGVNREKDFMYFVKDGAVWKVQRKQPGIPKGKPEKVRDPDVPVQMDTDYIYFVDRDGDISRAKRAVGGQKRKKTGRAGKKKAVKKSSAGKKKAAKKSSAGKKKAVKKSSAGKKKAKKKGKR